MSRLRETIRFSHQLVQLEDKEQNKNYALMGLEQGKKYTDEEIVTLCKMPIKVYPEGMAYDLFRLSGDERQQAQEAMNSFLNTMYGYNWMAVRDFILSFYEERLWDISQFVNSYLYERFKKDFHNNLEEFEECYGEYEITDRYEIAEKLYKRLSRTEEMMNPRLETRMMSYKISAMFLISPEILRTGRGKMYGLYPSVTKRKDFDSIVENYKKAVLRNFANISEVEQEIYGRSENKICLTKDKIAEWMGIPSDEILEVEGVIPFKREAGNKTSISKIRKIMK